MLMMMKPSTLTGRNVRLSYQLISSFFRCEWVAFRRITTVFC